MTSLAHVQDDRFREPGIAAPLTFLIMFVVFIYGALLVGLLGVANWLIHAWDLKFFLHLGGFGILLAALLIPALWAVFVAICATIPYRILRAGGHYIMASKVATIIVFAMCRPRPWLPDLAQFCQHVSMLFMAKGMSPFLSLILFHRFIRIYVLKSPLSIKS